MIRLILVYLAYPEFECDDCVGACACYCAAHDASAPGIGPTRLQRFALWLLR